MTETKIYGHRGFMASFPENTLLGFRKAIELGVDGIEIDVQLTKDGEVVVIHDETFDRTTDGVGYVKDISLKEMKQFSAGVNYTHFPNYDKETWPMERVPTLQEVLELLEPYPTELNIELKTSLFQYKGIENKVLSLVNDYGKGRKVIYSSFHLPSILRIKQLDPNAEIAWLMHQRISHPKDYLLSLDLDAFHLSKQIVLSDTSYLTGLLGNVRVWTVNDMDDIKRLMDLGVNAIISDFPEKALRYKDERK
ncbi:MAG TPA: glycerophosphodiester phosphodiesterase [Candidatus Pseudogracilibacillus intestinigallinarum]|uniref:Glycerophosphodiester phosphodiesterase n=1 Tax=Candidatus Pseudogracilibacillus intestinigallinarum TaxID=2838742 RepID=A0A9D1PP66_9BACI|nr:glycerophosphodiester phosphodiesterase [Candidatus Pseudogracilibacillus intestinigallinarum]